MKRFASIGLAAAAVVALVVIAHVRLANARVARRTWPVMGTVAALSLRGGGQGLDAVQDEVRRVYERVNDRLSAWNPASELSRVARADGTNWLADVSADMRPCYDAAIRLAAQSGRAFNPAVGAKLRALGVSGGGAYADFDLGAIAKGFAVDLAAEAIERRGGVTDLLLDLGGNLRVVGGGTWRTGVRNPFGGKGECVAVVALTNGESIATSGNYERFIERDGMRYSHILDGRTGEPTHGVAGVTVIAPRALGAMGADGLSTTLFILGPADGAGFLARHHPAAQALWIPDTPERPRLLVTPNLASRLANARWPMEVVRTASDGRASRRD